MCKFKIIKNLYYRRPPSDVFSLHMGFANEHHYITREIHHIIDLKLWFESDFEEGEELVIRRISENAKYNFNKIWIEYW